MCNPVAVLAVSTLVTAGAQYQQGETAKNVAEFNAQSAKIQADDVLKRGGIAEEQQLAKTRQMQGTQRAIMAASGSDTTTGSNADILGQTTAMGALDAATIRSNAARQAWGYENQATQSIAQGNAAGAAGNMGAFSTLLAGGSRAYGMYKGKS